MINSKGKVLLAVHEISWTNDPWKLTETVFEFGSTTKKHSREQEMKEHFFKLKSKPKSVAGAYAYAYATEDLDENLVATLKEERADWWDGGLK